jgi:hypothetical protein
MTRDPRFKYPVPLALSLHDNFKQRCVGAPVAIAGSSN